MQALRSCLTPNSKKQKTGGSDYDGEGSDDEMEKAGEIDGELAP